MRKLLLALLLSACALATPARAESDGSATAVDFPAVAADIGAQIEATIADHRPERGAESAERFGDVYFDVFEASGMEAAIGARDAALKAQLEQGFGALVTSAGNGEPAETLHGEWAKLHVLLDEAVRQQAAVSGSLGAFIQAFLILLREGFEAILVISALVAYLQRLGAERQIRWLWAGVGTALAASLAAAYAMAAVIRISGPQREAVEGATMLMAAAVLIYVSHWLFAKREAARWQGYIHARLEQAVSGGQAFSLALAAFLAVFREGAETVLFYQALLAGAPGEGIAVGSGFVGGAIALVGVYGLMRRASRRLPLGIFFTATAVLLYVLAFIFTGQGMLELQGAGWFATTQVAWAPTVTALGIFPTVESLTAQAVVLALLMPPLILWLRRRRPKRAAP